MQIKKIETYSLYEFCQAIEQNVKEGWSFDFSSNELFPTMFGSMLVAGMVKAEAEDKPEVIVQSIIEDNTEDNNLVKRGRKPNK